MVPYQLQACPLTVTELDECGTELGVTELRGTLEAAILDGVMLEGVMLEGATLEGATLDVTTELHTAPVITGTCALLLPLVPCTPNSTLEFTAILLFQFNGAAEYGFEPVMVAFQLLVTREPSL